MSVLAALLITIQWHGVARSYALHVPPAARSEPAPLLVVLHGAGGNGEAMAAAWQEVADQAGVIVAAPNALDAQRWQGAEDGPGFVHRVVEDVASRNRIDRRRVYLFGHSAGAHFALYMGLLESEYFAAVAVHAGALSDDPKKLGATMRRPIPIALWSGSDDRLVPVYAVRATMKLLQSIGAPVELHELRHEDHRYRPAINPDVWRFLSKHALPRDAVYRAYQDDAAPP